MRHATLPLIAALALAACSQSETAPVDENSTTAEPSAAVTAAAPANSPSPSASASASATPGQPAAPRVETAIPERFRGVWNNPESNCNPGSDLRMEIGASTIEFYESLGTVTKVTVESPDSIIVEMAMEGEGERWKSSTRYALSKNGTVLTPTAIGGEGGALSARIRCPK